MGGVYIYAVFETTLGGLLLYTRRVYRGISKSTASCALRFLCACTAECFVILSAILLSAHSVVRVKFDEIFS